MKNQRETSQTMRMAGIAIVGLFIALAAAAYLSGRQVQRNSEFISTDAVPGTIIAHQMRMAMSRGIGWVMVAASAQSTQSRDESLKVVHDSDAAFDSNVKAYEATIKINSQIDRKLLDQVKSRYAEYHRQRVAYEALILAGDRDGSAAFLERELVPAYIPAIRSAEELLGYNHANSITYASYIRSNVDHLYWAVAVVTLLAVICSVVLVASFTIRVRELTELRDSDEKFSKAFQSSPVGIAITELETGRYVEVNESFCRLLGDSPREVVGRTTTDMGIWAGADERDGMFQPLFAGGSVRGLELETRTRDGSRKTVSVNAELIELGGRKCVVSLVEDISGRKELQRKQAELAAIVESTSDAIIGKSLAGIITSWNRGAENVFGYTAAETIGQPLRMLLPPERQHEEEEIQAKLARGETVEHFDTVRVRKDGRRIIISATISPVKDESGKVIGASKIARDVTGQKQAEDALRESEARIRILGDNLPNGMIYQLDMGADGRERRFTYVSAGVEKLHGFAADAVLRDSQMLYGAIVEADRPVIAALEAEALAAMKQFGAELRFQLPSGAVRWSLVASAPRRSADGHVLWDGIELDITERKRSEMQIRHLNRVYAVLSEINKTIVREKDPQAMLAEACRIAVEKGEFRMAWIGMFDPATQTLQPVASDGAVDGYLELLNIDLRDKERSRGPSGRCFLSGEHVACSDIEHDPYMLPWRDEALQRGYRSSACFPLKVGDKVIGTFCLYSGKSAFFDAEELRLLDELAMDIAFALEVSEGEAKRRQAEQELLWRTAFFEAQVHSAIDGILVVDSQGKKLLQNQRLNELWKIPPSIAAEPDDSQQVQFVLGQVKEPEPFAEKIASLNAHPDESSRDEIELIDGTILERYSAPVRGSDGTYYGRVWTFHDLTESKKLEQQLLRSQRMESIGTLAGGIAHDLNNVLAPIIMAIDLMKMTFTDPASRDLLALVSTSAGRGADMVRQVLSFARGVEGRRTEVQIKHLIQDLGKIANDTFLKHIEVRTIVPAGLWTILGDATQLHQVLLNLAVNARDAMPNGGWLTIAAENFALGENDAGLTLDAKPGNYVLLQVEDSGTGMPPEVIEKIFDPFFTTKEIGKGTGLGLSTSLGIVKSHGGFMRVGSEPGKGTKFKVYLPARTRESAAAAVAADPEVPRGNGELILVVDDEMSVRQITRQALEAFGYRVQLASDGAEAVAIYGRRGTEIAVVLTDMTMPVMDGLATIQILRKMNPRVRVVAVSGLSANGCATDSAGSGVEHFLAKPYTAETLLTALHEVLSAGPRATGKG